MYFRSKGVQSTNGNEDDTSESGFRLEHGLAVVGFVIGFGFVLAVGLVYAKVQRVRRFKLLDNTDGKKNALAKSYGLQLKVDISYISL